MSQVNLHVYFSFKGEFYEQREDAAMVHVSPVSAVVANLYMEVFEGQALSTALTNPCIWVCYMYVDDIQLA